MVTLSRTEQAGGSVTFLWVPADVGVEGNEAAKALKRDIDVQVLTGLHKYKSIIIRNIIAVWQKERENEKKWSHNSAKQM